jgi:hypothetical protein
MHLLQNDTHTLTLYYASSLYSWFVCWHHVFVNQTWFFVNQTCSLNLLSSGYYSCAFACTYGHVDYLFLSGHCGFTYFKRETTMLEVGEDHGESQSSCLRCSEDGTGCWN